MTNIYETKLKLETPLPLPVLKAEMFAWFGLRFARSRYQHVQTASGNFHYPPMTRPGI